MTQLHLAPGLSIPVDVVTQTLAILAKRGAGKTYTAAVLCEELLKAKQHVVIVDPLGVHWGLRSSADGKSAGYPVVIFGGEHADVPLEEAGGRLAADFIIDSGQSVIVDLSLFRKKAQVRFMTDFSEQLYHRNRNALHIVIDEADSFAPQKPQAGAERLLGTIDDLVRRGRSKGIGLTLITQRSAVLNKNVLTQAEVLVAMRTTAPQDIAAVRAWVDQHDTGDQAKAMLDTLPSLPIGDAWVWSPGWLDIFKRVHIRERTTFDSSRTPKAGERRREPKALAPVDLAKLSEAMHATAERAKESDPKHLRTRIAELEAQLKAQAAAKAPKPPAPAKVSPEEMAKVAERVRTQLQREMAKRIKVFVQTASTALTEHDKLTNHLALIVEAAQEMQAELPAFTDFGKVGVIEMQVPVQTVTHPVAALHPDAARITYTGHPAAKREPKPVDASMDAGGVKGAHLRILDAIARLQRGPEPPRKTHVAFVAGYTENGHFRNLMGELSSAGLVESQMPGEVMLTRDGELVADAERNELRTQRELQKFWLEKIGGKKAQMLRALIEAYPAPVSVADAAAAGGFTQNGHFRNLLGELRGTGVLDRPAPGFVSADDALFPPGLPR